MGFTNRWVCKIHEEMPLTLEMIKKRDGHFWREEGKKFTLGRLIKLDPEIKSKNPGEYISGRFYFNWEQPIEDFEIREDGTIERKEQIIRRTNVIPFWISVNHRLILFQNSKPYTKKGKDVLARLFFNTEEGIIPVKFDIQAIEQAWRNGEFTMWTYSFIDRDGSVTSGIHYGENIDSNDTIYQETAQSPKNFIGITMRIYDEEIKVRVTREGVITFYSSFDEPQHQPELFRVINELLRFQI